jgi:hypothetical protein
VVENMGEKKDSRDDCKKPKKKKKGNENQTQPVQSTNEEASKSTKILEIVLA